MCVLHLAGPRSREVLSAIEPGLANLTFMRSRVCPDFGGVPGLNVDVLRVSFTGLQGFESVIMLAADVRC